MSRGEPSAYANDPAACAYRLQPWQDKHPPDAIVLPSVSVDLSRLPPDLLPLLLRPLRGRLGDLAACARVNKWWNAVAQPMLYERIVLRDQGRVVRLFASLAHNLHNTHRLRVLELRVYPFALSSRALDQMEQDLVTALRAASHLHALAWTRTGSLNNRIITDVFPHLNSLRAVELTGDTRTYNPALLVRSLPAPSAGQCKAILRPLSSRDYATVPRDFGTGPNGQEELEDPLSIERAEREMRQRLVLPERERGLEEVMLIMPDRKLSTCLSALAAQLGGRLRRLEVLCNHTPFLRDEHLISTAPHVPLLRALSIAGCKAVSARGFIPLLQAGQVRMLKLESVGLCGDDMRNMAPHLQLLEELTLTYPTSQSVEEVRAYFASLSSLVEATPRLRALTFYAPGGTHGVEGGLEEDSDEESLPMSGPHLDREFLLALLSARGAGLRTLRLYGMGMSLDQLELVTRLAPQLEDLVVHLYEADQGAQRIADRVARLARLRTLHLLSSAGSECLLEMDDMVHVAERAAPGLTQIGFRHRVWAVRAHSTERRYTDFSGEPWSIRRPAGPLGFGRRRVPLARASVCCAHLAGVQIDQWKNKLHCHSTVWPSPCPQRAQ